MLSDKDLAGMRATQEEALPDFVSISRPTGTTSTIGSRIDDTPTVVASDIPARVTPMQMYVTLGERAQPLDIDRYTIRLPRGTDVQKRDFVELEDGTVLEVERIKNPRSWETVLTIEADVSS